MKVLHLNAGNETGGGMFHILMLLDQLPKDEVILGVFENGELASRAKSIGIQTVLFEQSSRKDFSIMQKVVGFITEENVDVIHTHGARANLFGKFISKKTGCKWLTTIHSDPRDDFLGRGIKGRIFTSLNIWSIKKADGLFAISDRFKKMLLDFRIPEEKITTILNGVDFTIKSDGRLARTDLNLNQDDFVILMVARIEKVKDHMTAIHAVRKAIEQYPDIMLLIAGDGTGREEIARTVRNDERLSSNIQLLGQRSDVIELFPLADLCLLTSKSESFPLVLLEAAREGVPAITTDVGGVDKMIPSRDFGWIEAVGDVPAIARAITEAYQLNRAGKLKQMGKRFGDHCQNHFSIEKQARQIHQTYKDILKK